MPLCTSISLTLTKPKQSKRDTNNGCSVRCDATPETHAIHGFMVTRRCYGMNGIKPVPGYKRLQRAHTPGFRSRG